MQCCVEGSIDLIARELGPDRNHHAATWLENPTHLPQGGRSVWKELQTLLAENCIKCSRRSGQRGGRSLQILDRRRRWWLDFASGNIQHWLGDVGRDDASLRTKAHSRQPSDCSGSGGNVEDAFAKVKSGFIE